MKAILMLAGFMLSSQGNAAMDSTDSPQSRMLVSVGDKAPGPVGGEFTAFKGFALNRQGQVIFVAAIRGGRAPGGLFRYSSGGLSPIVLLGDSSPLGGVFADFVPSLAEDLAADSIFLNDLGTVAFGASVVGGSSTAGIFRATSVGKVEKVVATSDDSPLGGRFGELRIGAMNEQGDVAFVSRFSNGQQGLFIASSGSTQKVAAVGESTAGAQPFANFHAARLNRRGEVAFVAELMPPSIISKAVSGIFLWDGVGVRKVALETDASPIGGSFGTIDLLGGPALNDDGQMAFVTRQRIGVVYRAVVGNVLIAAKDGDQSTIKVASSGSGLSIYNDGTVAFLGANPFGPTLDLPVIIHLAGERSVSTIRLSIPLTSISDDFSRIRELCFKRTDTGRALYTVLVVDKNGRLEAHKLFVAE